MFPDAEGGQRDVGDIGENEAEDIERDRQRSFPRKPREPGVRDRAADQGEGHGADHQRIPGPVLRLRGAEQQERQRRGDAQGVGFRQGDRLEVGGERAQGLSILLPFPPVKILLRILPGKLPVARFSS